MRLTPSQWAEMDAKLARDKQRRPSSGVSISQWLMRMRGVKERSPAHKKYVYAVAYGMTPKRARINAEFHLPRRLRK